jgi:hypothetical protein
MAFGIWALYAVVDLLYGMLRKFYLASMVGDYASHIIGVVIVTGIIVGFTYLFIKSLEIQKCNKSDFLFIGILWFVLSVSVEFGYHRYIAVDTWEPFLSEFNILEGRLFALVFLMELAVPYIFGVLKIRSHYRRRRRRVYSKSGSTRTTS